MNAFAEQTPYYAVIFSSLRTATEEGYSEWNEKLFKLVENIPGYLGYESYRNENGHGVTISYWKNLDALKQWKENNLHRKAQELGREKWYTQYKIRVCKVENEYGFSM